MATAETYLGAALAAITAALFGIFSWAWNLAQRVTALEATSKAAADVADRLSDGLIRLEGKIDRLTAYLLERRDGRTD
jgi:hypothetical protein